jgi:hypothetical protein
MANGEIDYRDMNYQQIYWAWSSSPRCRDFRPHELETIHNRWKRLGKLAAAGRL